MSPRPLRVALRLIDLKYSPVPIANKKPLVPWREYQFRAVSVEDALAWWGNGRPYEECPSMAVLTGWNHNLVVVDTDTEEAEAWAQRELPTTPRVVITRRGKHRHYRHPGEEIPSKPVSIDGVTFDLKGDRGMCTAPGSVHPSGVVYKPTSAWSERDALPLLPRSLVKLVTPRPLPPPVERREFAKHSPVIRLEQYLRKHPLPPIGSGSDRSTFLAAVFGLEVGCSDDEIANTLATAGGFDVRWVSTKVRAAHQFKRA